MTDVILKLESIRDDQRDKYWAHLSGRVRMGRAEVSGSKSLMGMKPFVKEVIGINHEGRLVKKDVSGKKEYREAVGTGARGVFYWYSLRQGGCYLIQEQVSRRKSRKYYALVNNGELHELTEAQAASYVSSIESVLS